MTSSHPKHTRTNISLNVAKRMSTTVSNSITRDDRLVGKILIKRKYYQNLINNSIKVVEKISTHSEKQKENTIKVIPYISNFQRKEYRNLHMHTIKSTNLTKAEKWQPIKKYKSIKSKQKQSYSKDAENSKIADQN